MTDQKDPLSIALPLDRVYYATGMMLDAEDFQDEQNYHRARLARALSNLHGSGTAAGLEVVYNLVELPPRLPGGPVRQAEQLVVRPGLAIDRLGRMIESPNSLCLRLDVWFESLAPALRVAAFKQSPSPENPGTFSGVKVTDLDPRCNGVLVADLFLQYEVCERGKTPAFAAGPFDANQAVQPARLRDGAHLVLVPRREANLDPIRPFDPWESLRAAPPADRRAALRAAIFAAWPVTPADAPVPAEYPADMEDHSAVFLARIAVHVQQPEGGPASLVRLSPLPAPSATVDNDRRLFVLTTQALAASLDLI